MRGARRWTTWLPAGAALLVGVLVAAPGPVKLVALLAAVATMAMGAIRLQRVRAEVSRLNARLAAQARQRERDLRGWFECLTAAERARAVAAERERILRDMHDGVGANLAAAMRQLESGTVAPGEVATLLRESLDQLKLTIDAMSLPPGDVNALLASLRWRLGPRIEQAGLAVQWDVDALPLWRAPCDDAMRHLQYLLLEAMSNALQHASAATLWVGARAQPDGIRISVADDGRGIDATSAPRLRTMRERAAAIGAGLRVECAAPGTRVHVLLTFARP
jgi:hypothetical protein